MDDLHQNLQNDYNPINFYRAIYLIALCNLIQFAIEVVQIMLQRRYNWKVVMKILLLMSLLVIALTMSDALPTIALKIPAKLGGKTIKHLSIKAFKKLSGKAAKRIITHSLMDSISKPGHNQNWSFEYYEHKFSTISETLQMLQKDIDSLTQILETNENVSTIKRYRDMAIQIVLFLFVIVTGGAVALLAYKSRNSMHLKRMWSLIRSLANLKADYKSKMHIIRTKEEVDAPLATNQALNQEANI